VKLFRVFVALLIVTLLVLFSFSGAFSFSVTPFLHENYIILTTKNLVKSAGLFASYREKSFNTVILTLSDIGSSKPSDIREYLKNHFSSGYLLIIGSEDTIPRPSMYPSEKLHNNSYNGPSKTETDLYYGLLSENIDKDGDGFPGELWDDRMNVKPDLVVGRIPFDDNKDVEKVFEDTVNFENNAPQKAVLAGAFISYPGEVYAGAQIFNGDGAREEKVIGNLLPVKKVFLFNKEGSFPSVYLCSAPLNKKNFYNALSGAGFVDWSAHGSSEGAYNEVWYDKNKNGVPDDGYKFEEFISKDDNFAANGIFFSGSCLNEHGDENLGTAVMQKGAAAFIGSTEISFSPSYFASPDDGGSASIKYYFVKNLVDGEPVGKALYGAFTYCFDNLLFKDLEDPVEGMLMNIYDFNLYGDPALTWYIKETVGSNSNVSGSAYSFDMTQESNNKDFTITLTGDKNVSITVNSTEKKSFFILFPAKQLFVNSVPNVPEGAILDKNFGMIRLNNFFGRFVFSGKVRGTANLIIKIVPDKGAGTEKEYFAKGFSYCDFSFDGKVDASDFAILVKNFGKTYMNLTFNRACDINFDHVVNGKDLFLFLQRR
jgi:hypothetical protein